MSLRIYVQAPLATGAEFALPAAAARHVQVRRMQPGDDLVLFNGAGGQWQAQVLAMGRASVQVRVLQHQEAHSELTVEVSVAIGMPANERMDWLIEKATELGVANIQPLMCERSVLRLAGEREQKKREHWQGVAIAAAEQSGRVRVPSVAAALPFGAWLPTVGEGSVRWLLSLAPDAAKPSQPTQGAITLLSGPEGGLTHSEQAAALAAGFVATSLGSRTLRAETAPLAALAWLGLSAG